MAVSPLCSVTSGRQGSPCLTESSDLMSVRSIFHSRLVFARMFFSCVKKIAYVRNHYVELAGAATPSSGMPHPLNLTIIQPTLIKSANDRH
jgi:hypothetical protein